MSRLAPLVALGWLGIANTAMAACPYDSGQLLDDMGAAEGALRAGDAAGVAAAGQRLEEGFACMSEILPQQQLYARAYRAVAAGAMAADDEGKARGWMLTANELDPTFEYGVEDMPEGTPTGEVYREIKIFGQPPKELAEGAFSGEVYLDGTATSTPEAIVGRPHVVQLKTGSGVKSWVIKGNQFPPEVLGAAVEEGAGDGKKPKKEKGEKSSGGGLFSVVGWEKSVPKLPGCAWKRSDGSCVPPTKVPFIAGGVGVMASSAVVYFVLAENAEQDFLKATTPADVDKAADKANLLVLTSAGLLVVGAAGLTVGAVLDAEGQIAGPSLHMRW